MAYTLLKPDNPKAKDYLYSGENIFLSPEIDPLHIEKTINNLPEDIINKGIFALGPALKDYPRIETGSPGIPENKHNFGLLGIYIPQEFVNELDKKELPLWLSLIRGKFSEDNYISAAQHVISGYIENAVK
ncbi:hypothetical protein GQ472_03435 [archaeon]|nr:hypothetical protein [archaeon]